ncbi:uncharacterized protein LOC111324353 [Stylophora pistillata]|uniref:uncharacterized protein LOC111324353 n=1 Tax=Stylophora pistillata TaxID=50429 RepID=UPI000C04B28E|nr:uncharacterized protein LOC111324353 [Stylophora pistillata]
MAGYEAPPGPYAGFQPSVQPIGLEMHQQPGYPLYDNGPGYPNPPSHDIYRPTNEYASYPNPSTPSYHHHGDSDSDNLPPVGFEGISKHQDPETATASGVKILEKSRESPVPPPDYNRPLEKDSHRVPLTSDVEMNSGEFMACENQMGKSMTFNVARTRGKDSDTLFFKDGKRRVDYILAYEIDTTKDREWQQKREEKRLTFEQNLERANLILEAEGIETSSNGKTAFIKIHAPWKVLIQGAEEMLMKMPIREN